MKLGDLLSGVLPTKQETPPPNDSGAGGAGDGDEQVQVKELLTRLDQSEQRNKDLEKKIEEQAFLTIAQIGELRGKLGSQERQAPPPSKEEVSDADLIEAAKQDPGLMAAVIDKIVERRLTSQGSELESRILGKLDRSRLGSTLESRIIENYEDEIRDRQSPILQEAARLKRELAGVLDPSVRDTDIHDRLAFLMAAGLNPDRVHERVSSRTEALKGQRERQIQQLRSLIAGGDGSGDESALDVTDGDLEIAERLNINLRDPKTRERFLKLKKSERLIGTAGAELLGNIR